jgi:hypothetical protein
MSTTEDQRLSEDLRLKHDLFEVDLYHMLRKGWFPQTAIPALEEMRVRHEELIDQRDAKQAEVRALRDGYDAEDKARQEAVDAVYSGGKGPKPESVKLTPPEKRKRAIAEAEAHAHGAAKAALAYAYECLDRLRGPVPDGWNPHLAAGAHEVPPDGEAAKVMALIGEEEARLRTVIIDAQRVIAEADLEIREYHPLKTWLLRNGNGGSGQLINALHLTVPERHTIFTKPEGTPDPADWPEGWQTGRPVEDEEEKPRGRRRIKNASADEEDEDDTGAVEQVEEDGDGGFFVDPITDAAPLNRRKEQ